jgi:phosphopantetheinyl transferase
MGELTMLGYAPEEDVQTAAFFTSVWTGREALAKQAGIGMPLQFDCSAVPSDLLLLQGILPDTQTSVAVCAPLNVTLCLAEDSLPILFP